MIFFGKPIKKYSHITKYYTNRTSGTSWSNSKTYQSNWAWYHKHVFPSCLWNCRLPECFAWWIGRKNTAENEKRESPKANHQSLAFTTLPLAIPPIHTAFLVSGFWAGNQSPAQQPKGWFMALLPFFAAFWGACAENKPHPKRMVAGCVSSATVDSGIPKLSLSTNHIKVFYEPSGAFGRFIKPFGKAK